MRILLTGSSGFVGSHLQQALCDLSHEVIPCSRASGVDFNNMLTAEDWLPHLNDIDVVINCVGIIAETRTQHFRQLHQLAPIALFDACQRCGIHKVIQISALGADDTAFTPYQLNRKVADDFLRASTLNWTIIQPSLIYGEGSKSFRLFQLMAKLPLIAVPGNGEYLVQPVHISDVVRAVLELVTTDNASKKTIAAVGTEAVSYKQWLQAIRNSLGKKPALIIPIPFTLLFMMSKVFWTLFPLFSEDNLKMLQAGNSASAADFTQLLQRPPLSVEEGLKQ